tara:strand:- start:50 stop:346 length:297 start_codon:yes stop_codon:yes gene_type:complete
MTDLELKEIDDLVLKLKRLEKLLNLSCNTEVAEIADVACLEISQACKLINRLEQENACLEKDFNLCYDELETTINNNIAQNEHIIKLEAQLIVLKLKG